MTHPHVNNKAAGPSAAGASDVFVALDQTHQQFLDANDELEELIRKIETDGITRPLQARAASIAQTLARAAEHHEDEERDVFPVLLARGDAALTDIVRRLHQDHGWLEENWLELGPHLQAIGSGYGTWDVDTLRAGIPVMAALLRDHVALEESIAYPQARAQLSADTRNEMGRAMAARHRAARLAAQQRT